MRQAVIKRIGLPNGAIVNRKIAKKVLSSQADLTNQEKELLTSDVESIYLLGVANQQTTKVPEYTTDEIRYSEVLWVYVKFREDKAITKVVTFIHKALPNPCVLFIETANGLIQISTSHKRINKSDPTKTVLVKIEQTTCFSLDHPESPYQPLLDRIQLSNLPFIHLERFYEAIHEAVRYGKIIEQINLYPSLEADNGKINQLLDKLGQIEMKLKELTKQKNENLDFGRKMELHMQMKKQEQQQVTILKKLKELC